MKRNAPRCLPLALFLSTACPSDPIRGAIDTDASTPAPDGGQGTDASGADAAGGADASPGRDAGPSDGGTASGGAAFRGMIHFTEAFEDNDFASRGWYDSPGGDLSSAEHIPGSSRAFECRFLAGGTGCSGGTPGRHLFPDSESVYLSYWVKYSDNWVGSQRPYHPHELHFVTNKDDRWVGPSFTHLTTYVEQVGGIARLAIQDGENVDLACILRNDDSFVGCGGDFSSYVFTEARSVASCNGLLGDLDKRDCFSGGDGTWNSVRAWAAQSQTFEDQPGPGYKGDWHFVEAYFELNTVSGGIGQIDGRIRYWMDGVLLISSDRILMRTGLNADLAFNQFLIAPHIGDGSPVEQVIWLDDLTVASGP